MEAWKVEEKAGACIFSVYVTPGSREVVRVTGVTAAQVRALAEGGGKAAGQ